MRTSPLLETARSCLRWYAQPMSAISPLRVPGFGTAWEPWTGVRSCLTRTSPAGCGRTRSRRGLRSALAIAVISAFWFATAWPNGPTAVVVAAVVCSLIASIEQPDKISMALAATVLIAAKPVFATQFYLLPLAVDFPSMAAALAPLMLEHVPSQLNQGDSLRAKDERVYRH